MFLVGIPPNGPQIFSWNPRFVFGWNPTKRSPDFLLEPNICFWLESHQTVPRFSPGTQYLFLVGIPPNGPQIFSWNPRFVFGWNPTKRSPDFHLEPKICFWLESHQTVPRFSPGTQDLFLVGIPPNGPQIFSWNPRFVFGWNPTKRSPDFLLEPKICFWLESHQTVPRFSPGTQDLFLVGIPPNGPQIFSWNPRFVFGWNPTKRSPDFLLEPKICFWLESHQTVPRFSPGTQDLFLVGIPPNGPQIFSWNPRFVFGWNPTKRSPDFLLEPNICFWLESHQTVPRFSPGTQYLFLVGIPPNGPQINLEPNICFWLESHQTVPRFSPGTQDLFLVGIPPNGPQIFSWNPRFVFGWNPTKRSPDFLLEPKICFWLESHQTVPRFSPGTQYLFLVGIPPNGPQIFSWNPRFVFGWNPTKRSPDFLLEPKICFWLESHQTVPRLTWNPRFVFGWNPTKRSPDFLLEPKICFWLESHQTVPRFSPGTQDLFLVGIPPNGPQIFSWNPRFVFGWNPTKRSPDVLLEPKICFWLESHQTVPRFSPGTQDLFLVGIPPNGPQIFSWNPRFVFGWNPTKRSPDFLLEPKICFWLESHQTVPRLTWNPIFVFGWNPTKRSPDFLLEPKICFWLESHQTVPRFSPGTQDLFLVGPPNGPQINLEAKICFWLESHQTVPRFSPGTQDLFLVGIPPNGPQIFSWNPRFVFGWNPTKRSPDFHLKPKICFWLESHQTVPRFSPGTQDLFLVGIPPNGPQIFTWNPRFVFGWNPTKRSPDFHLEPKICFWLESHQTVPRFSPGTQDLFLVGIPPNGPQIFTWNPRFVFGWNPTKRSPDFHLEPKICFWLESHQTVPRFSPGTQDLFLVGIPPNGPQIFTWNPRFVFGWNPTKRSPDFHLEPKICFWLESHQTVPRFSPGTQDLFLVGIPQNRPQIFTWNPRFVFGWNPTKRSPDFHLEPKICFWLESHQTVPRFSPGTQDLFLVGIPPNGPQIFTWNPRFVFGWNPTKRSPDFHLEPKSPCFFQTCISFWGAVTPIRPGRRRCAPRKGASSGTGGRTRLALGRILEGVRPKWHADLCKFVEGFRVNIWRGSQSYSWGWIQSKPPLSELFRGCRFNGASQFFGGFLASHVRTKIPFPCFEWPWLQTGNLSSTGTARCAWHFCESRPLQKSPLLVVVVIDSL